MLSIKGIQTNSKRGSSFMLQQYIALGMASGSLLQKLGLTVKSKPALPHNKASAAKRLGIFSPCAKYEKLLDDTEDFFGSANATFENLAFPELGNISETSCFQIPAKSFNHKTSGSARRFAICEELERSIYIGPETTLRKYRQFLVVTSILDDMV